MTTPDPWTDAESASEDLRAALKEHGLSLPSLGIDILGVTSGHPLVSLGSAPARVVHEIAAALRSAL